MPKENLPSLSDYTSGGVQYVKDNYDYVKERMKAHQNSSCTTIAFVTDIHMDAPTSSASYARKRRLNKAITVIKKLSTEFKIHACVLGGDYQQATSSGSRLSTEASLARFSIINQEAKRLVNNMHVMICRGNHDGNSEGGYDEDRSIDVDEYCDTIQDGINGGDVNGGSINKTTGFQNKYYGYFDDKKNKVRIIYLNTYDLSFKELRAIDSSTQKYKVQSKHNMQDWAYIKQEQINFLIDALTFSESGWGVVIFGHIHICADNDSHSVWAPGNSSDMLAIMKDIVQAYKNKAASSYVYPFEPNFTRVDNSTPSITVDGVTKNPYHINVSYDFTNNKSNLLIASIQGHRHSDSHNSETLSDGTTKSVVYRTKAFYTHGFIYSTGLHDCAFDIITVDRSNNNPIKLYFDRYGDGISRVYNVGNSVSIASRSLEVTVLDSSDNPVDGALVVIKFHGTTDVVDDSKTYTFGETSASIETASNVGKYWLDAPSEAAYFDTYNAIVVNASGNSYRREMVGTIICGKTGSNGKYTFGRLPSEACTVIASKGNLQKRESINSILTSKQINLPSQ